MEVNAEKQQLSKVIQYIRNTISENQEFYRKLYNLYNGDLANAKRLTEKIYSDVVSNYKSNNIEMYKIAGTMNGHVYGMQLNISYVLDNLSVWIEEQQIRLNRLQEQYNQM
ncbi:MAG: hypothetical protein IKE91_02930 [Clostridia bacterium]|nr:hypothetical protein [Clostridia bacterium]